MLIDYLKKLLSVFLLFTSSNVLASDIESLKQLYKRPVDIPFPDDNPYSLYKATLGKMLFFDPRLSKNQNISCATCHNPSFGWEGALPASVGAKNTVLGRHSPTTINMAWGEGFFWDGRAESLEEQALGPIENEVEMAMPLDDLVQRLSGVEGYKKLFNSAFTDGLTEANIAKSIATFERTVISGLSPFDRWIEGDEAAISEEAKQGFIVFNGKGHCADCHSGWNFTDHEYHDIGLPDEDIGRYAIDPSTPKNKHAFKTPSLRNIAQRAPYMHDGKMANLSHVIAHYIDGGIKRPSLSDKIKPLQLTGDEFQQLIAFLNTLQGKDEDMPLPILPL